MKLINFLLALAIIVSAVAQNTVTESKEAAYTRTITQRADKIVQTLGIVDSTKAIKVRDIISDQYRNLNTIHTKKNDEIKAIKSQYPTDKELQAAKVKEAEEAATKNLDKLHKKYISKLSKKLSDEQVEKVKDGMTYNVLNITYKGYQDMIPTLTEDQKKQVYTWLVEAREKAMDAESSEKKHATFGKYKGRINNYLSAAGYNLKKEGEEWEKRLKTANATRQNQ